MKILKILSIALGLSSGSLWAQSFIPSQDSILTFHEESFPLVYERLSQSPMGQFCASNEMAEFWKPLQAWWEKNTDKVQQELKLAQKPQLTDIFKGEILFSLDQISFDFDNKEADFFYYALIETGKDNKVSQSIIESMTKSLSADDEKNERKDVKFMNYLFHTFSNPKFEDNKSFKLKKDMQLRFGQLGDVFYIGCGRTEVQEKKLSMVIPSLGKSKQRANDIDIFLNMTPLNKLIAEGIKMSEKTMKSKPQTGPAMFLQGLDFVKLVSALGLLDFKSIMLSDIADPKFEKAVLNIELLQEPRGLLKMFMPDASMNLGEVPAWIPEDAVTYQASSFPLSQWYGIIVSFLQQEIPAFAPMVMGQLDSLKQSLGVDLDKDIFGLLDNCLYQVVLNAKENSDLTNFGEEVYVVKLKNGTLLEQNLLKLLKMAPMYKLEAVPYMGGRCYEFPANPETGVAPMLAFYNEYLLYSNKSADVRSMVLNMNKPSQKTLSQSRQLNNFRSVLPERYQSLSYQNSDLLIRKVLGMLGKNAELINATMEDKDIKFDFTKLPKPEDVHLEFGSTVTVTKAQGKSIHCEIYQPKVVLPKK